MTFNNPALLVGAPTAFVLGAIWNSPPVFGTTRLALLDGHVALRAERRPSPAMILAELIRCTLLSVTVGIFAALLAIDDAGHAVMFALLAWFGFQAVLLSGGIVWEGMPLKLYLIHAGDALQKAVVLSLIFALI